MSAQPKQIRMTIDEFLAFYEERADGERWELIEGVARMSPSPTELRQMIATNLTRWLLQEKVRLGTSWIALLGVGTRVPISPDSLPQPDVFVKSGPVSSIPTTDNALVLFEILSKSNTIRDQAWRRKVYASVVGCEHYVTFSQTAVSATRYDKSNDWQGTSFSGLEASLPLPGLGPDVGIPLAEAYRWTQLGPTP